MITTTKKTWIKKIVVAILLSLVVIVNAPSVVDFVTGGDATQVAYAAEAADTAADTAATEEMKSQMNFLLFIQNFLNRLLWPILVMIGGLMDNSILFGSGMEATLRAIWIPIRNIVNILFVIVLVGVALYNVLGIGEDGSNYSIKSILPKIIIGIIAVNFSFLGIKVLLDGVNVMTTAIFALPDQVSQDLSKVIEPDSDQEEALCWQMSGLVDKKLKEGADADDKIDAAKKSAASMIFSGQYERKEGVTIGPNDSYETILGKIHADDEAAFKEKMESWGSGQLCAGLKLNQTGKAFLSKWSSHNAALAMAINMGGIWKAEQVDLTNLDSIKSMAISTLFSVLLYVMYAASFIALFVVLLARLVVLWLAIAMSPVLLILMAIPELKDKMEGIGKISEQFVKNAIAPILIALPMTIGWIMLSAVQDASMLGSGINIAVQNGFPVVGASTLQEILMSVGTLAVIWLGVFSAAEGTLAQAVTDTIKNGVQQGGKFVGMLPLRHLPLVPVDTGDEEGQENYSINAAYTALSEGLDKANRPDRKLAKRLFGEDSKSFDDFNDVSTTKSFADLAIKMRSEIVKGDGKGFKDIQNALNKNTEIARDLRDDPKIKTAFENYLEDGGKDKDIAKTFITALETKYGKAPAKVKPPKVPTVATASDPKKTKQPTATSTSPAATTALQNITENTNITYKDTSKNTKLTAANVTALGLQGTALQTAITDEKPDDIKKAFSSMVTEVGGKDEVNVEGTMTGILDADVFKAVKKAYGGDDAFNKEFPAKPPEQK